MEGYMGQLHHKQGEWSKGTMAVWGAGSTVTTFHPHVPASSSATTPYYRPIPDQEPPTPAPLLHQGRSEVTASQRALYVKSHRVLCKLTASCDAANGSQILISNSVELASKAYLRALKDHLDDLNNRAGETGSPRDLADATVAFMLHTIWGFADILMLQKEKSVAPSLAEWMRGFFHYLISPTLVQEINDSEAPETHPGFWRLLNRAIFCGDGALAVELLGIHSGWVNATEDSPLTLLKNLLNSWPSLNLLVTSSAAHAEGLRRWKVELESTRRALMGRQGSYGGGAGAILLKEVLGVVSMISGDDEALVKASGSWIELMVGRVLFQKPMITKLEMYTSVLSARKTWALSGQEGGSVSGFMSQAGTPPSPTTAHSAPIMEVILVAFSNFEGGRALELLAPELKDQWGVAHLSDLIARTGGLPRSPRWPPVSQPLINLATIPAVYMVQYAEDMILSQSHGELWRVGCDYLSICGGAGYERLAELLGRLPVTEGSASHLLNAAQYYGLKEAELYICQEMAFNSLRLRKYGAALQWAEKTGSVEFVDSFVPGVLDSLLESGSIVDLRAVADSRQKTGALAKHTGFLELYKRLGVAQSSSDPKEELDVIHLLFSGEGEAEGVEVPPAFILPIIAAGAAAAVSPGSSPSPEAIFTLLDALAGLTQRHDLDGAVFPKADGSQDVQVPTPYGISPTPEDHISRSVAADIDAVRVTLGKALSVALMNSK